MEASPRLNEGFRLMNRMDPRPVAPIRRVTASTMTATVVVATKDRAEFIEETLTTILGLDYPALDVIVVDQSSGDETRRIVRRLAEQDVRLRLISNAATGLSAARNVGAWAAASEIVVYCGDDCLVSPHWLHAIAAEFSDPSVSAVYGRLLPHGKKRQARRDVGCKETLERQRFTARTPPWCVGHGGNMAFRRASLAAVGGFDPLLGAGAAFGAGEDSDIAYRLLAQGRTIAYSPAALSYHKHCASWLQQQRAERQYGIGTGAQCGKYVREGDVYGAVLFCTWVWRLGVRRMGSGLVKQRSPRDIYLGYCQLIYPFLGLWRSLSYPLDRRRGVYRDDTNLYAPI